MRTRKFVETLTIKISSEQRDAIDALATSRQDSIGSITRGLLAEGLQKAKAMGPTD